MENKRYHNAEERVFREVCWIQTSTLISPKGNNHLTHKPIYPYRILLYSVELRPHVKKRCSRQDSHTCILWIRGHFITLFLSCVIMIRELGDWYVAHHPVGWGRAGFRPKCATYAERRCGRSRVGKCASPLLSSAYRLGGGIMWTAKCVWRKAGGVKPHPNLYLLIVNSIIIIKIYTKTNQPLRAGDVPYYLYFKSLTIEDYFILKMLYNWVSVPSSFLRFFEGSAMTRLCFVNFAKSFLLILLFFLIVITNFKMKGLGFPTLCLNATLVPFAFPFCYKDTNYFLIYQMFSHFFLFLF